MAIKEKLLGKLLKVTIGWPEGINKQLSKALIERAIEEELTGQILFYIYLVMRY